MRVVVLGSGSSGNAILVEHGATALLIDCGFSARETARRLISVGVDPSRVAAVLVSHEHTDHVRGLDVFARRYAPGCAVVATPGTLASLRWHGRRPALERIRPGTALRIGTLTVTAYRTSHDAAEPVGYRIDGPLSFGLLTDSGEVTPDALEMLAGVELLGLELNHDAEMLMTGPYPWHLKRRIASERGHLSNEQALCALGELAHPGLRGVIALHRSRTNNTEALVLATLTERLARLGTEALAACASQDEALTVTL